MNANELADKLEGTAKFINNISNQYHAVREVKEAATMLRQQQAEIKTLEGALAQLKHMNKNWQISENILLLELEKLQSRELTADEDIHKIWASENGLEDMDMCKFADFLETFRFVEQAILRKAQEK